MEEFLVVDQSGRGYTCRLTCGEMLEYSASDEDRESIERFIADSFVGDELNLEDEATKITRIQ